MFTKTKSVPVNFSKFQLSKKELIQLKGGTDTSKDVSTEVYIVGTDEIFD